MQEEKASTTDGRGVALGHAKQKSEWLREEARDQYAFRLRVCLSETRLSTLKPGEPSCAKS